MPKLTEIVKPPAPPARGQRNGQTDQADQTDQGDEEQAEPMLDDVRSKLEAARDTIDEVLDLIEAQ